MCPHALGFMLGFCYVMLLVSTNNDIAMSRDEGMYVDAAENYGRWFQVLMDDPKKAINASVVDGAWGNNHEHPSLVKSFFALSWLSNQNWHWTTTPSLSHRLPAMIMSGMLLWLLVVWGTRFSNIFVGVAAAILFGFIPRIFYHAHLNCFDVPVTLMVTLCSYVYWRGITKPKWHWFFGIAFGFSLLTKHNTWILPGVLGVHHLYLMGTMRKWILPRWLLSVLLFSPVIVICFWPWLWPIGQDGYSASEWIKTWERIKGYVGFHMHHDYYNFEYFGRNYFRPPFPISFPWAMFVFTVPFTLCFLVVYQIRSFKSEIIRPKDKQATAVLWFGLMLAPMLVIALPSTPIFGGTKHFFTAYPFVALYAGVGLHEILREMDWQGSMRRFQTHFRVLFAVVSVLPSIVDTARSHPFALSHYSFLAGGSAGGADMGMARQFWGYTTGSLRDFFKNELPQGGSVWICDMTPRAFNMMKDDGTLPQNIHVAWDVKSADFSIVHHEKHFDEVDTQIWELYGTSSPYHVLTHEGVPIISVYKNPYKTSNLSKSKNTDKPR